MALDELINHNVYSEDDGPELRVNLHEHSDSELCNIFNELKENATVERVVIELDHEHDAVLGVKPSLALAAAISKHPSIKELWIWGVESISSFGAIAVAIQQSKTLSSLDLRECSLSLSQMAELEWLLAENGLEYIAIECCKPQQGDVFCIANGLESNQSLKGFYIENWFPEDDNDDPLSLSVETMEAIPRLIERSKSIESICLERVALPPEVIVQIAEASSEHRSLKKISLCAVGSAGAGAFPRLLEANSGVETLDLSCNDLSDTDVSALSSTLRGNTSLKELKLYNSRIGSQGAAALANALYDNSTLKSLCLCNNQVGDAGAAAFARALTSNTTLAHLGISHFSEEGLNAFSSCLPSMNGLKSLFLADIDGLSPQSENQFLKALNRNDELEEMFFVQKMGWFRYR